MSEMIEMSTSLSAVEPRYNWTREEVEALFALPFNDLIFEAQNVHLSLIHI